MSPYEIGTIRRTRQEARTQHASSGLLFIRKNSYWITKSGGYPTAPAFCPRTLSEGRPLLRTKTGGGQLGKRIGANGKLRKRPVPVSVKADEPVSPHAQGGGGNAVNGQRALQTRAAGRRASSASPASSFPFVLQPCTSIWGNISVSFSFMRSHVFSLAFCIPDSICRPHFPVCLTGNLRRTIIFIVHTLRRRGEGGEEAWRRKDIPTGKKAPWF